MTAYAIGIILRPYVCRISEYRVLHMFHSIIYDGVLFIHEYGVGCVVSEHIPKLIINYMNA